MPRVAGALLFLLACAAATAARGEVPLELALAKTYLENPRLLEARARLRAVREGVSLARAGLRPRIEATTGLGWRAVSDRDVLAGVRQTLSVEQPLYDGGATGAAVRAARFRIEEERARLRLTEQQVLLEAVEAYTAVLRDQRLLAIALENERRLQERLAAAKRRYRHGQISRTEVARAEARYAEAVATRQRARGNLERAGARYRRVIGDPPGGLRMPGLPAGLPTTLDAALEMIEDHPLLRLSRFAHEAARAETGRARAALLPRISLSGRYTYLSEPDRETEHEQDLAFGAFLTLPLYAGGAARAAVRQKRQRERAALHALDDARRRVREEIRAAFEALRIARLRRQSLARRVAAARLVLEGSLEEARAGTRSLIEVLDAERERFLAESAAVEAAREEIVAAYRLLAATGRLTLEDLGIDASSYDEEAYYRELRALEAAGRAPAARHRPCPLTGC